MIDLIIDSTEFSNDLFRKKRQFKALARLAELGVVKLHMPYIVMQELVAHIIDEYRTELVDKLALQSKSALCDDLKSHSGIAEFDFIRDTLREINENLTRVTPILKERLEVDTAAWVHKLGGVTYNLDPSHAGNVVTAYFNGIPPFEEGRIRDHFPDAFIIETIKDILKTGNLVAVISNDNHLLKTSKRLKSVKTFKTLFEFIKDRACLEALLKSDKYSLYNFDRIRDAIKDGEKSICEKMNSHLFLEHYFYRHEFQTWTIPSSSNVYITEPDLIVDLDIERDDIAYVGNGEFIAPAIFILEGKVEFFITKEDYHDLGQESQDMLEVVAVDAYAYHAVLVTDLTVEAELLIRTNISEASDVELRMEDAVQITSHGEVDINSIQIVRLRQYMD